MVGNFVAVCLASQKPSERDFFVPTRTDLGVKLLCSNVLGCDFFRKYINKCRYALEPAGTFTFRHWSLFSDGV